MNRSAGECGGNESSEWTGRQTWRVSCFQENLSKGLSIVGRAVSSRSTLPVLGNILLEARNDQLRLAATNLEIGINCWIGASGRG